MQQRIAIDMDEVMADTWAHQLNWLNKTYGYSLQPGDPAAQQHWGPRVDEAHAEALQAHMHKGRFFADIPLMHGCAAVVRELCQRFEVFITTAAMDYPRSCDAKFDWLQRHFPYLDKDRYVFCGDKAVIRADYLIDDSARHFERFGGQGILFEAPHNLQVEGFVRVKGWAEVQAHFSTRA